jgi:UDP-galactopyranose mutase
MRERAIVCFSHLRWDFVYQRPQHLLSRLARRHDIHFFEEPQFHDDITPHLIEEHPEPGVTVLTPQLPRTNAAQAEAFQDHMLRDYVAMNVLDAPILWYYTPMALGYTWALDRSLCVYDCMDELAMFANAPADLQLRERQLFSRADVVFTGGRSLYYAKRRHHPNVKCFPSAVDAEHFAPRSFAEPRDLAGIPHPRFGFYGVVDERFDTAYLDSIAGLRPQWQFVVLGPTVKIDPRDLPRRANITYIGQRSYSELPAYLQHWDMAMLPFALNAATRFISPTKTLEYLAARKPAISTPIADVVDPYGEQGLVAIAATPEEFVDSGERLLRDGVAAEWHTRVDRVIRDLSWDATVQAMERELSRAAVSKAVAPA